MSWLIIFIAYILASLVFYFMNDFDIAMHSYSLTPPKTYRPFYMGGRHRTTYYRYFLRYLPIYCSNSIPITSFRDILNLNRGYPSNIWKCIAPAHISQPNLNWKYQIYLYSDPHFPDLFRRRISVWCWDKNTHCGYRIVQELQICNHPPDPIIDPGNRRFSTPTTTSTTGYVMAGLSVCGILGLTAYLLEVLLRT